MTIDMHVSTAKYLQWQKGYLGPASLRQRTRKENSSLRKVYYKLKLPFFKTQIPITINTMDTISMAHQ